MKKVLIAILSLITYIATAQESSEERMLPEFSKIDVKGIENIYLTQGSQSLKIVTKNESTKKVLTEVKDNTLIISQEKKSDLEDLAIYISTPNLKRITLCGVGNIIGEDTLKFDNLKLEILGAGNMELILNSTTIYSDIAGAGNLKLSGKAKMHEILITGAGDLNALDLQTEVTKADVAGAGDIQVNATEELTAVVSGAGDVYYKNEPKNKNISISGAGDIYSYQNDSTNIPDTTKLKLGNYKLWIIGENDDEFELKCDSCEKEPEPFKHWAGLELGANGYLNSSNSLSVPAGYDFLELNYAKSLNLNLNILEKGIKIHKDYIKIVSGLGFQFNSYSFNNNTSLIANSNPISAWNDTILNYTKNKLNVTYATIPLMLAINSHENKNKSLHFSAGVVGGYRIGTKYKVKYAINNDEEYKNKVKSNYNLSPYQLNARASIGYGNFNLYATYSLTEFFEKNKGPELHPFTVGIRVIPF